MVAIAGVVPSRAEERGTHATGHVGELTPSVVHTSRFRRYAVSDQMKQSLVASTVLWAGVELGTWVVEAMPEQILLSELRSQISISPGLIVAHAVWVNLLAKALSECRG